MNAHESKPTLPIWIFVVTDLALIGAAAVIAYRSSAPLSGRAMLAIVGCVGLGAIVGLVPLIVSFERQKNAMLDDRQRALEALARTVSSSAEQISIATGSLHEIAEVAQKNLRHADHLPHKLQEKIAEFQAQLAAANDAEKEELEKELTALRTTESERLESISTRIAKSAAEWAKLEAGAARHLAAANELLAKLPAGASEAIGKAQAAGLVALGAKLAEVDAHLAATTAKSVDRISLELGARLSAAAEGLGEMIARMESVARKLELTAAAASVGTAAPAGTEAAPVAPSSETTTMVPKRPRRVRREGAPGSGPTAEPTPGPASDADSIGAAASPAGEPTPEPAAPAEPPAPLPPLEEPVPIPAAKIVEVVPVAPATAEPFIERHLLTSAPTESVEIFPPIEPAASTPAAGAPAAPAVGPARKRAARKPEPERPPTLDLPLDEPSAGAAADPVERTLTSDGATRLLATAYIGIGNRLFIRGDGPGLSWDKGVPLQFVSIGKWRWETSDAVAPVQFKLYKNDEQECTALGGQTLEPGHLQEMTATF